MVKKKKQTKKIKNDGDNYGIGISQQNSKNKTNLKQFYTKNNTKFTSYNNNNNNFDFFNQNDINFYYHNNDNDKEEEEEEDEEEKEDDDYLIRSEKIRLETISKYQKSLKNCVEISKKSKSLLPHEKKLLKLNKIKNITHKNSNSIWLETESTLLSDKMKKTHTLVYRPMGDKEILFLIENGFLPDTQPYQAIIEGSIGRNYSEKYLNGKKYTNTYPSTVVEFIVSKKIIKKIKKIQSKPEDGCISMGLGKFAGRTLPIFNECMKNRKISFKIVKIKRKIKK